MRKLFIFILAAVAALVLAPSPSWAQDDEATPSATKPAPVLIFDSSNHYTGGCSLTDSSTFTLKEDLAVEMVQFWYNWQPTESTLAFTLSYEGEEILSGDAERTTCDPYQKNWCNGDFKITRVFKAGTYSAQVAQPRLCLVPGGTGAVRLYGPAPAPEETPKVQEKTTVPGIPIAPAATTQTCPTCECPKSSTSLWVILSTVVGLALGAAVVALVKR